MRKVIGLLFMTLFCAQMISAQSFYNFRNTRNLIGSVGTGVSSYFGDLNEPGDIIDTKINLNVGLQYFLTNRIAIRGELAWFQLSGSDRESSNIGRTARNLSFTSDNYELSVVGIINAFPNGVKFYQRPQVNFYGFGGIGLLYFNPKGELNGERIALQPLLTEGVSYSRTAVILPFGGGIKAKAGPFLNIALEGSLRVTFTDYLDDVSTVYRANSSFTDEVARTLADRSPELGLPLREAGSIRGNPDDNDSYFLISVKLEYFIPTSPVRKNSSSRKRRLKTKRRPSRRR